MHLPGPFRAAVGLVASASTELRKLPDRAIELPMLAVSTALQVSLRAQQRYAQLAAKGDEVLNRDAAGEDPPPWATFDEPVPAEELHRSALAQLDTLIDDADDTGDAGRVGSPTSAGRMFESLFGVDDPGASVNGAGGSSHDAHDAHDSADTSDDGPTATVTPISEAVQASGRAQARSATPRKATPRTATPRESTARSSEPTESSGSTTAKKATARKTAAKKTARKAAARKATARSSAASSGEPRGDDAKAKSVSPPRHTAPSKFDTAGDEPGDD